MSLNRNLTAKQWEILAEMALAVPYHVSDPTQCLFTTRSISYGVGKGGEVDSNLRKCINRLAEGGALNTFIKGNKRFYGLSDWAVAVLGERRFSMQCHMVNCETGRNHD